MLFSYVSGQQWIGNNKKWRWIAGIFDCHAVAAVRCGEHRPIQLEMCLRRQKSSACHLAGSGHGREWWFTTGPFPSLFFLTPTGNRIQFLAGFHQDVVWFLEMVTCFRFQSLMFGNGNVLTRSNFEVEGNFDVCSHVSTCIALTQPIWKSRSLYL